MKKNILIGILAICLLSAAQLFAEEQSEANLGYSDARVFNNNGIDFISQAKHEEAVKEFKKALAIDPDFHIARYNLALAYYNAGNVKEAISEFEYLINSAYYFVNAHYNLGTIYLREGMVDKAIEQLKVVTELDPNHAEAHFNLGFIYFKRDLLDEALVEYRKALQIKPDSLKGHLSLAFLYEKKAMYPDAQKEYSAALELAPDNEEAKQALGSVKAIAQIKETLKSNPKDGQAYVYLGHIYYARDMYREALDSYNQALQYNPNDKKAKEYSQKAVVQLLATEEAKIPLRQPKNK